MKILCSLLLRTKPTRYRLHKKQDFIKSSSFKSLKNKLKIKFIMTVKQILIEPNKF